MRLLMVGSDSSGAPLLADHVLVRGLEEAQRCVAQLSAHGLVVRMAEVIDGANVIAAYRDGEWKETHV